MVNVEAIAEACHETNRVYCESLGDNSQLPWSGAPEWQKESVRAGVRFHLDNPGSTGRDSHDRWLEIKLREGWRYGLEKNADIKTHPCCLPYHALPEEQKAKDDKLIATIRSMAPDGWDSEKLP